MLFGYSYIVFVCFAACNLFTTSNCIPPFFKQFVVFFACVVILFVFSSSGEWENIKRKLTVCPRHTWVRLHCCILNPVQGSFFAVQIFNPTPSPFFSRQARFLWGERLRGLPRRFGRGGGRGALWSFVPPRVSCLDGVFYFISGA